MRRARFDVVHVVVLRWFSSALQICDHVDQVIAIDAVVRELLAKAFELRLALVLDQRDPALTFELNEQVWKVPRKYRTGMTAINSWLIVIHKQIKERRDFVLPGFKKREYELRLSACTIA